MRKFFLTFTLIGFLAVWSGVCHAQTAVRTVEISNGIEQLVYCKWNGGDLACKPTEVANVSKGATSVGIPYDGFCFQAATKTKGDLFNYRNPNYRQGSKVLVSTGSNVDGVSITAQNTYFYEEGDTDTLVGCFKSAEKEHKIYLEQGFDDLRYCNTWDGKSEIACKLDTAPEFKDNKKLAIVKGEHICFQAISRGTVAFTWGDSTTRIGNQVGSRLPIVIDGLPVTPACTRPYEAGNMNSLVCCFPHN